MISQSGKSYILYVEDDIEDVELLKHVLEHTDFEIDVVHVADGEKALRLLEQVKDSKHFPEIIFLDINLPKMDGKETFVCLQADKAFARIPVVVLSTSSLPADSDYFKKFQIPYIVKPGDVNRFKENLIEVMNGILPVDSYIASHNRANTHQER
jgi:CheY-like chemotaxis protein